MPKKFSTKNPKSVTARDKKKQINEEKELKEQQQLEDSLWVEDDRKILKRLQKKEAEEKKKQEQYKRRSETKALLENELVELTNKSLKIGNINVPKVTRAEISSNVVRKKLFEKETHLNSRLEENVNRIRSNENIARTVEHAISVLGTAENQSDKHPEKRQKAGYREFEERRLRQFKDDNPNLRISQMKQLIFKEWQKSAENPMNVDTQ